MTTKKKAPAIIRRARPDDAAAMSLLIHEYVAAGTLLPRPPEFIVERSGASSVSAACSMRTNDAALIATSAATSTRIERTMSRRLFIEMQ